MLCFGKEKSKLTTSFQGKFLFNRVPGNFTHRKGVDQVPAELLCQEIRNAAALHDLRKLGWVAKRVWKPELKNTEKWFLEYAFVTEKWLYIQRSTRVVSPLSLSQWLQYRLIIYILTCRTDSTSLIKLKWETTGSNVYSKYKKGKQPHEGHFHRTFQCKANATLRHPCRCRHTPRLPIRFSLCVCFHFVLSLRLDLLHLYLVLAYRAWCERSKVQIKEK